MVKNPNLLLILDGWGVAPHWGGNAIAEAKTKNFNLLWNNYPSCTLLASGEAVGLPPNSPGNSEAGHLNLGAGHVVKQDISLIDKLIEDKTFFQSPILLDAIKHAANNHSKIHLLGLLSETGTHSHVRHLYALLEMFKQNNFRDVYIHLFSDGRDADPMNGIILASQVENRIKEIGIGRIVSISGRFFAMDRDNRWGRVSRAYNMMVRGEGNSFESAQQAFSAAYASGQTDEFIEPRLIASKESPKISIQNNDAVIIFNFRGDRIKELTQAFLSESLPSFSDRLRLTNLYLATFAIYEDGFSVNKVFAPEKVNDPLGKIISDNRLSQIHIAETEKYPHVTYFFNGGVEKPFPREKRYMIPSLKNIKTYDFAPKMSAAGVLDATLLAINRKFDFILTNFANPDMVGHTGNFKACVHAVEYIDDCLGKITENILKAGGNLFVVGDHGNAEQMVNPRTGEADTEHTTNPVPFIIASNDVNLKSVKLLSDGILACVAPTILETMGLFKPVSMVNQSLIIKE